MAGTAQFNGEVVNIESNINKVNSFDKNLSEDAAKQKYPSIQCLKEFLSVIYPVGSIYISTVSTSPSTLFGGTWEQIKDTFLLAAGSTYAAGATGGEATHTLTESELANHRHEKIYYADSGKTFGLAQTGTGTNSNWYLDYSGASDNPGDALNTGYSGGNQPHNNMPPYLAVYVWKRTA